MTTNDKTDRRHRLVKSESHATHDHHRHHNTSRLRAWVHRRFGTLAEHVIARLAHHDTALKFLAAVDAKEGVNYAELEDFLGVGRRQVKGIAMILRNLGLVVTNSCPAHVYPKNRDMKLVIKYILETLRPTLAAVSDAQPSTPPRPPRTKQPSTRCGRLCDTIKYKLKQLHGIKQQEGLPDG